MTRKRESISRRRFNRIALMGTAFALSSGTARSARANSSRNPVRLGGPVFYKGGDPEAWADSHKKLGYGAATCPLGPDASDAEIEAYRQAARKMDLVIAEVGAWSNPVSRNEGERQKALEKCRNSLALADRIGARCCVNISGSRSEQWDGPHPDNFTRATFDLIVESTRSVIDAVRPKRTFFTLETMPWAYPDSPDSYRSLIKAIDRKQFAVHLDPVNMISSPQRYYSNGAFIRDSFKKLGPQMKACHAKDILLQNRLTTHLDEVRPGLGNLDYEVFLSELSKLPDPPPLIIEHLKTSEEYRLSAEYIRGVGKKIGVPFIWGKIPS